MVEACFFTVGGVGVMCGHDAMLGVWLSSYTGLLPSRLHLSEPQKDKPSGVQTSRTNRDRHQVSFKYLEQSLLGEHPSASLGG